MSAPTLATTYDQFLADAAHLDRLHPHALRAYRYELAAAADSRFAAPLETLSRFAVPMIVRPRV